MSALEKKKSTSFRSYFHQALCEGVTQFREIMDECFSGMEDQMRLASCILQYEFKFYKMKKKILHLSVTSNIIDKNNYLRITRGERPHGVAGIPQRVVIVPQGITYRSAVPLRNNLL